MYSDVFCKVYDIFGWNYYPEAFGEQLLEWMRVKDIAVKSSMDLACGTGILCQILHEHGIDAAGMDFSEGMIEIARSHNPDISYDVADMIRYRPEREFDLVTCTGDALNHILDIRDVEQIFRNVYGYLARGGYFVFDILNENEVSTSEPFDMDFSDTVRAVFQMTRPGPDRVRLQIKVYENGQLTCEENINEKVHDPLLICELLKKCGFTVLKCSNQLLDDGDHHGTTWFVIAKKPI